MSEQTNIFEQASRLNLRFPSQQGELTVEHLWSLPLTSVRGASLDNLAVGVNRAIKEIGEESFVDTKPNPQLFSLKLKLEILKHIIAVKQAEATAKAQATARQGEIARLEEVLTSKKDDALKGLSEAELEAKLKELRGS